MNNARWWFFAATYGHIGNISHRDRRYPSITSGPVRSKLYLTALCALFNLTLEEKKIKITSKPGGVQNKIWAPDAC